MFTKLHERRNAQKETEIAYLGYFLFIVASIIASTLQ